MHVCACVHVCVWACMHHSQADPESAEVKENVDGAEEQDTEEKVLCVRRERNYLFSFVFCHNTLYHHYHHYHHCSLFL